MQITAKQFSNFKSEVIQAITEVKAEVKLVRDELHQTRDSLRQEIRDGDRDTRDLLTQEIRASEYRVKKEITDEFVNFIDHQILPQFDNHEGRLVKLEAKSL